MNLALYLERRYWRGYSSKGIRRPPLRVARLNKLLQPLSTRDTNGSHPCPRYFQIDTSDSIHTFIHSSPFWPADCSFFESRVCRFTLQDIPSGFNLRLTILSYIFASLPYALLDEANNNFLAIITIVLRAYHIFDPSN